MRPSLQIILIHAHCIAGEVSAVKEALKTDGKQAVRDSAQGCGGAPGWLPSSAPAQTNNNKQAKAAFMNKAYVVCCKAWELGDLTLARSHL